jgi:heme-degrading monooxygenase HmoA
MVLFLMKWNISMEKKDSYTDWTGSAIKRTLGVPGVTEFRAYRPVTGPFQVVVTYEFSNMNHWANWYNSDAVQAVFNELRNYTTDVMTELWGPSPVVTTPIKPGT